MVLFREAINRSMFERSRHVQSTPVFGGGSPTHSGIKSSIPVWASAKRTLAAFILAFKWV